MRSLLRFVLVGVANTAVYYLLYRLLLLGMPYVPAHLLGWSGAVVFSFFANSLFTFGCAPPGAASSPTPSRPWST
ncbi:GtrA family protein [Serinicoccus marinus]|uniref:GtrA family protein n=1 Tax=Serinicoccus marinus TaxID=247333 RepID=UPI001930F97C|nr:GtrA family protein [Serinicoccus marinus]